MANEVELAAILCSLVLNGEVEQRHYYPVLGDNRYIKVDCETDSHVVEVGFDVKRGSLDSLHQALFAANLTGKIPMVVVIDTNGVEEAVEHQIETVSRLSGVEFRIYTEAQLMRHEWVSRYRLGQPEAPYRVSLARP